MTFPSAFTITEGLTVSMRTWPQADAVHPFEVFVTVTQNVPAVVTLIEDVVRAGLVFQLYVIPVAGFGVAVSTAVVRIQFSESLLTLTVGRRVSTVTVPHAVAVQPDDCLVTVTQYVPPAVTTIFCVV